MRGEGEPSPTGRVSGEKLAWRAAAAAVVCEESVFNGGERELAEYADPFKEELHLDEGIFPSWCGGRVRVRVRGS